MARLFGIEFIPLNIPRERRFQALVVLLHVFVFILFPFVFSLGVVLLLLTNLWWVSVGYLLWVYYDIKIKRTAKTGGRRSDAVRSAAYLKHFRNYFPMSLVKTADLHPSKNYIIAYHPHGIVSFGAWLNFGTEATNVSARFPGINIVLLTLELNLTLPLVREYGLLLGLCDVSKDSINWLLSKMGTGNAVVIVPGGAAEALESRPGIYKVVLKKRKGFVRLAIQHGADLVPAYGFGESNLWDQAPNPKGSPLRKVQTIIKHILTISPPVFYGRGLFNHTFGLMPYRTPVKCVVGRPIPVPHEKFPSQELVDEVHSAYIAALCELFDEHKVSFNIPEWTKLTVM